MEQKILRFLNETYQENFTNIESVTNEMFRCTTKDGDYFARVTNYKPYEEQLEEVNYTNFLFNEGLGVSPGILSSNNKFVEKVSLQKKRSISRSL